MAGKFENIPAGNIEGQVTGGICNGDHLFPSVCVLRRRIWGEKGCAVSIGKGQRSPTNPGCTWTYKKRSTHLSPM